MTIAHKDPFDCFLIAQAQAEVMLLVSNEALFDGFAYSAACISGMCDSICNLPRVP